MKCPIRATTIRATTRALLLACISATATGCVTPAVPVTTVWQKLGIPQTGARLRDSALNRRGNFPGLEKKPPLLKLADPANLAPDKPKMIQTAAKIKAAQDMKQQKIKALKFLAEVNCGCYNKDKSVEKAFLEALDDCDADVRQAAVEALDKTISACAPCRSGCETTCCTEDLYKKLNDIAYGREDGCYKEPVAEIRAAAAAVTKKCGCFKPNPIEELPAPAPLEPEELHQPPVVEPQKIQEGKTKPPTNPLPREGVQAEEIGTSTTGVYRFSDTEGSFAYGMSDNPEVVVADAEFRLSDKGELQRVSAQAQRPTSVKATTVSTTPQRLAQTPSASEQITNPERLVSVRVIEYRSSLGEMLVELPDSFQLRAGWTMVVVDGQGNQSFARISECGGRRLLLTMDDFGALTVGGNRTLKLGLVDRS